MSADDIPSLWRVARTLGRRRRGAKGLPPMLFFTDPRRTPMPEATVALLPRDSGVVFRAFGCGEALSIGLRLANVARQRNVCFLVGADAALATRLRADGVHLPERMGGRPGAIRRLQERFLVTAAAHSLPAAIRAARAGVDAIVISPVFESGSPSAGTRLGSASGSDSGSRRQKARLCTRRRRTHHGEEAKANRRGGFRGDRLACRE